jgi:hypothetical protein
MNTKTPINWESIKNLPDNYQGIVESIIICSDLNCQIKHWLSNNHGLHFFDEDYYMFDGLIEWFKSEIIKDKPIPFNAKQAREIINLYSLRYEFMGVEDPKFSEDNPFFAHHLLNHHDWLKICEQAKKTLDLFTFPFPKPAVLPPKDAEELKQLIKDSPHDEYITWGEFKKILGIGEKDNPENS